MKRNYLVKDIFSPWVMAGFLMVLGVLLHAAYYYPFIADDALISLRYSERFLQGKGLSWNDDFPVEGYSNFLWVILCALLGYGHENMILAARLAGILSAVLSGMSVLFYGYRVQGNKGLWIGFFTSIILILLGPVAVWSIGGLEQPLLMALLFWIFFLLLLEIKNPNSSRLILIALLMSFLVLTRPDGILFIAGINVGLLWIEGIGKKNVRKYLILNLMPAFFLISLIVFRKFYYHDWVPNTAHAKLAFSYNRFLQGFEYMKAATFSSKGLVIASFIGCAFGFNSKRIRTTIFFVLPSMLLWYLYVTLIGGDIFPAWRHFIPAIVFWVILFLEGILQLEEQLSSKPLLILLFIFTAFIISKDQWSDNQNKRAKDERWEWEGEVVGQFLNEAFGKQQPLLAVDSAGCLPFFSKLPSLDMLGLNDSFLAKNPPPEFGSGFIGHELGSGKYVWDRNPDLIIFCGPRGNDQPCYRSGIEIQKDFPFRQRYKLIEIETKDPKRMSAKIWINRLNEKVGLVISPKKLSIPSYLFDSEGSATTFLSKNQSLETRFDARLIRSPQLHLKSGSWKIRMSTVSKLREEDLQVSIKKSDGEWRGEFLLGDVINLGEGIYFIEISSNKISSITIGQLDLLNTPI